MRKSKSSTRTRLVRAGVAVGAIGAAALIAPQAAWAAPATPNVVSPGSTTTIADAGYTYGAGQYVQMTTAASCATHYTTANNTAVWDASKAAVGGNTHAVTVTIPAVTLGTNGVAKAYMICVYDSNNTTTSVIATSAAVQVAAAVNISSSAGPSGGGNSVVLNAPSDNPVFTGLTSVGAVFTTAACPTAYGTPTAGTAATDIARNSNTQVTLTVPSGVTAPNNNPAQVAYTICLYGGNTSTSTLIADANYAAGRVVLSQNNGPVGGNNGLTVATADPNSTLFATTPGVVLRTGTCTGTNFVVGAATSSVVPIPTANLRRLSDTQIAFQVPNDATNLVAGDWNVCIYDSTSNGAGNLIGSAVYTLKSAVTLTRVSPAAGPTNGNTKITVYGDYFPTDAGAITATLGGVPLLNITPGTAYTAGITRTFTAYTPPHSADNAATLVVTTATGTKALQNAFAFQNSINVAPKTAPNTTTSIDLQVGGSGFLGLNFGTTAAIYLTDGPYNPSNAGGGVKANGPLATCGSVLVVSDSMLVCTLSLNRRFDETGSTFNTVTYANATNTTGPAIDTTAGSPIIDATNGTFSWKDVGQNIADNTAGANIPANTTIVAVLSRTRAVMSKNAIKTDSLVTHAAIGNAAVHSFTGSLSITGGSTTLNTTSSYPFTAADVGRVISGATTAASGNGLANGTTIVSVAPDGLSATVSAAAGASGFSSVNGALYPAAPVPNGAYTLNVVSNNAVDANTTDPAYQQSAVTSGSTFTVAPA